MHEFFLEIIWNSRKQQSKKLQSQSNTQLIHTYLFEKTHEMPSMREWESGRKTKLLRDETHAHVKINKPKTEIFQLKSWKMKCYWLTVNFGWKSFFLFIWNTNTIARTHASHARSVVMYTKKSLMMENEWDFGKMDMDGLAGTKWLSQRQTTHNESNKMNRHTIKTKQKQKKKLKTNWNNFVHKARCIKLNFDNVNTWCTTRCSYVRYERTVISMYQGKI